MMDRQETNQTKTGRIKWQYSIVGIPGRLRCAVVAADALLKVLHSRVSVPRV